MEHSMKPFSESELPILTYTSDSGSGRIIPHDEESQDWIASRDESVLSSSSESQLPKAQLGGHRTQGPPNIELPIVPDYKESNNRAVKRTRNLLSSGLASSAQNSSNGGTDSFETSESESDLSYSADSDDSEVNENLEVGLVGQQFLEVNGPIPRHDEDPDLDTISQPGSEVNAAARAPFREGGLPSIPQRFLRAVEPSEITDFGELMFAKNQKARHQESASSLPSRSSERRTTKKTLQQQLFSVLQQTHTGKKEFFPRNLLPAIITEHCVREELTKHLDADAHNKKIIAEYANKICQEFEYDDNGSKKIKCFRKIFVILVLIEKTPAIIKFLEMDINDSDLPLEKVERANEKGAYDLRLSRNPTRRLKCFSKKWNQLHIRNFEQYQWMTLSPFFCRGGHKNVKHYVLPDQVILPFISASTDNGTEICEHQEFEGGFGRVFKAHIHSDHHNFNSLHSENKSQSFAIKKLHSQDKRQFKKEVEMLKKFSDPAHEHLISLLATYEQHKNYYLVFHWADATLQRYWKDINPTPSMDIDTVIWVAKQCKGIVSGVVKIHQYRTSSSKLQTQPENEIFGHHGDIKPENVLWFPEPDQLETKQGTLKLSDFGLAEFSMHQTMSMMPKSNFATSPPYRAPEVDLEGTGAIGRSYDMWTLGCVYLEFITWLIGGWNLVDSFEFRRIAHDPMVGHDTRTFFRLVKIKKSDGTWEKGAEIKPVVKDFINELYADKFCTKFLRDFLDMVRDDLLVIKTLDREKRGRKTSQEVHKKLCDMLKNCEADEDYACKPITQLDAVDYRATEQNERRRYQWTEMVELPEATPSTDSSPSDTA